MKAKHNQPCRPRLQSFPQCVMICVHAWLRLGEEQDTSGAKKDRLLCQTKSNNKLAKASADHTELPVRKMNVFRSSVTGPSVAGDILIVVLLSLSFSARGPKFVCEQVRRIFFTEPLVECYVKLTCCSRLRRAAAVFHPSWKAFEKRSGLGRLLICKRLKGMYWKFVATLQD